MDKLCNSFKAIHFSSKFTKKCETMIRIINRRKGQTYEQIKLAKNRLSIFTSFNPVYDICRLQTADC